MSESSLTIDRDIEVVLKACPVNDSLEYVGSCPATSCPYSATSLEVAGVDCLHPARGYHGKGGLLDLLEEVRSLDDARADAAPEEGQIDADLRQLSIMALEYAELMDSHDPDEGCPECGYFHPCKTVSLCGERKEVVTEVVGSIPFEVPARRLWRAVAADRASFLSTGRLEAMRELVTRPPK